MQQAVEITVHIIRRPGQGIQVIVQEFFQYQDRPIGNRSGPLFQLTHHEFDRSLAVMDFFEVAKGFLKIFPKPFHPTHGAGEIEPVEYRKFLFGLKNGQIIIGKLI